MKKLFSFALIALTASVVHGAAFTWVSDVDLVDQGGISIQSTDYSFVLACIGDGSGINYSSAYDNICNTGSFSWMGDYNEITGTYALTAGKDVNGMIYTVLAQKNGELFFLNNYDSDGYIGTYTLTGFEGPASTPPQYTFGGGDGFVIGEVVPTPEPTSGLLVLMGLAGLMLRRKRV